MSFGLTWDAVSTHFWSYLFVDLGGSGGKSSVSFPGVFMSAICRLKACSAGTLMSSCSGEKLQGEVYQKVNQLIPPLSILPKAPVGN